MKKLISPFIVIIIIILLSIISCGTYIKQPVASHIVAVTMEGDTILVAIDKIRPNQYNSYYYNRTYYQPYYNPYYGNQYRFRYPDNRGVSSSVGVRSSNEIKIPPPKGGGTTYSPGSGKSISRIDYAKPIKRSKD
jgi:hypothetical protein|tara:strand:+ start:512 stop:916 length:405 start_codon:yes stop_codon:yes gene_type:complete